MTNTDSKEPANTSTTIAEPEKHTVVVKCVVRRIKGHTRRAGAYVAAFVDSEIPPIVETYAGNVPALRYCHLTAIKAVLRRCSPDQEIHILCNYARFQNIFEMVNSSNECAVSINHLLNEVQSMLDERTGRVQLGNAKTLVSASDQDRLKDVALTACDSQIANASLQLSEEASLPQPTPYTLEKSDISLRIQSIRKTPTERTKKQERKAERVRNKRMEARGVKRKLKKEENEVSLRAPRTPVTIRSYGTNPFLLNHQYEGHDPSAPNKRIKLLDSSLDGEVVHSADTVEEPTRPTI